LNLNQEIDGVETKKKMTRMAIVRPSKVQRRLRLKIKAHKNRYSQKNNLPSKAQDKAKWLRTL
jgi:hypothetical protein